MRPSQLIDPPVAGNAPGIFTVTRPARPQVSAKDYIETNVGIHVTCVNSLDDVLPLALAPQ